jgi:RNA polymerase sigma-70 factor (ECF subfamily)
MRTTGSVTRLIDQLRSDDSAVRNEAARQVWLRYFPRLLDLARQHLNQRIRRREDEEDVLQSMYKSFCLRLQNDQFELEGRGDLWNLLVTMTLHKTRTVATRHRREGRDVRREQPGSPGDSAASLAPNWAFEQMEAAAPTPAEAAVLTEEFQRRLQCLPEQLRNVAQWRLEGYSNQEIAGPAMLNCSERTVERKLNMIRKKWEEMT